MINELYFNLDTLEFTQKVSIDKNEILIYDLFTNMKDNMLIIKITDIEYYII